MIVKRVFALHRPPVDPAAYSALLSRAVSGDVLLRRGRGIASSSIVWFLHDGSGCSHCALLVSRDDFKLTGCRIPEERIGFGETSCDIRHARLLVIQSVAAGLSGVDGVQIQTLEGFLRYSVPGSTLLYRPVMDNVTRNHVVAAAAAALEQGIPFDHRYGFDNPGAVYCTGLLFRIFKQAGWEGNSCWQRKHGILTFSSFLHSPQYRRIYPPAGSSERG